MAKKSSGSKAKEKNILGQGIKPIKRLKEIDVPLVKAKPKEKRVLEEKKIGLQATAPTTSSDLSNLFMPGASALPTADAIHSSEAQIPFPAKIAQKPISSLEEIDDVFKESESQEGLEANEAGEAISIKEANEAIVTNSATEATEPSETIDAIQGQKEEQKAAPRSDASTQDTTGQAAGKPADRFKDANRRVYYGLDLKQQIESLLFSSGKTMTEKELISLTNSTPGAVRKALEELKKDYEMRETSLVLMQSGDSWKLNVREKFINLVTKIVADTELPFPILETLSVIAYKAPVMQADVIKARGTNAYEHVQELIESGFVERRKKGRSFEIGLTSKFFEYFDVEGDQHLKQLLKDVRPLEAKKKKLGNLEVIDLPNAKPGEPGAEGNKQKLGELEVIDTVAGNDNAQASEETTGKTNTEIAPPKEKPRPAFEQNKPDMDFLSRIDQQINEMSKRYDNLADDELFKRPTAIGAEESAQGNSEVSSEGSGEGNPPVGENLDEATGMKMSSDDEQQDENEEPKIKQKALLDEDDEDDEPGDAEEEENEEKGKK